MDASNEVKDQSPPALWKEEYKAVKDEQIKRVSFRDNLLYVNILVVSGIVSYVVGNAQQNYYGLLVIGWSTLVLGWTYLVNDEKISAIGRYIRGPLSDQIRSEASSSGGQVFGWEIAHRSDLRRVKRKIEQLVIDEISFVLPGITAASAFLTYTPNVTPLMFAVAALEIGMLCVLGLEIWAYADLRRGK